MSTAGQPILCKAAVAWAPKEDLRVEEIEVAAPRAGEVRVRIAHTAVCHTDLYTHGGAWRISTGGKHTNQHDLHVDLK